MDERGHESRQDVPVQSDSGPGHLVRFFDDDAALHEAVAEFILPALLAGGPALVIAAAPHRPGILGSLESKRAPVASLLDSGRLVLLDPHETLALFMEGETPDRERFRAVVGGAIDRLSPAGMPFVYGDMVDVLWREGRRDAAHRLEELWNELARTRRFRLLCGYHLEGFAGHEHTAAFDRVCDQHTDVIPSMATSEPGREQRRNIARLEQRNLALEREVQARLAAEEALKNALREHEAVTELAHRDEDALRLRAAAIVESSEDAIISKDLNGDVTSWNEGAERLYGYTAREMIGRSVTVLIPEDHTNEFPTILARFRDGERIEHYETVRVAKDGRRIDVSLTISPIKDRFGNIVGASKIARDITDRKRTQEALRESEERLARELRRKDEFIAILAHELRNPLAPVRNASHYLCLRELDAPDLQQAVQMIDKQVSVMSRLIDDLLDVARISRGTLELRPERALLQEIVETAVEACRHEVDASQQQLRVTLPKELIALHADRTRLIQVLCNLITNAAKFSPRGSEIDVRAWVDDDGLLSLSVRDRGVGIPREKLAEIFELFTQLDRSLDRQNGGLGIGLTIARQIIELHGGSIEARSEGLGHGSEFIVRIPVLPAPHTTRTDVPAPGSVVARRVLVADDNRDAADSLAMLLEWSGHKVILAYDGRSALDLAAKHRPEVLLLDIGMPELDGFEVARRIRDLAWGRDVMLVALTGWGQEEDERRVREAGFDAHIVKPAKTAVLNRLLSGARVSGVSSRR